MKKRVAIFQNTLTGGGRIRVINEMIGILNELEIVPDVFVLRVNKSFKKNKRISFRIRKLPTFIYGLYELKIPYLNLMMRFFENDYDLYINSNNSLLFAPSKVKTVAYIHFPREARIASKYKSLVFPDGALVSETNIFFRTYRKTLNNLHSFRSYSGNNKVITNSECTKNFFKEAYPEIHSNEILVIYPPVATDFWKCNNTNRQQVVTTLGRFSEDKRQLEQIQIAESLPELQFNIIGFVSDTSRQDYYQTCERYVAKKQITNVTLYPNLTSKEIKIKLQQSKFFLHNLRNEPFGISTVEAIAAGCIPLVHNSGGQKEIVPFEQLLFEDKNEAVKKLTNLQNQNLGSISRKLQNIVSQYDASIFRKKMKRILTEVLDDV